MRAGARLEGRHRDALRVLRRALPTLEQQVQLVAALDGYEDGIPWVLPPLGGCSSSSSEGGDECQFGGLGCVFIYYFLSFLFFCFLCHVLCCQNKKKTLFLKI